MRQAILAQFPALTAGALLSRDPVEGVNDFGPTITLTLPLFNRNRGQIAIQRATRAELRQAYQARLDLAVNNADQAWKASRILEKQLRYINLRLPVLEKTAMAAEQNFQDYHLSAGLYVSLESSLLATQAEKIRLRASLETTQSTLRTLLGLPFCSP